MMWSAMAAGFSFGVAFCFVIDAMRDRQPLSLVLAGIVSLIGLGTIASVLP